MRPFHLIVSCEHGGNLVPQAYDYLFAGRTQLLDTHRGWDIGAMEFAKELSDVLHAKFFHTRITRLLVDCNRSENSAELYSEFSRPLKKSVKEYLLHQYYYPYRHKVEHHIEEQVKKKPVIHLSIHSFTPIWHGEERMVDVGLLFDDERKAEQLICSRWQRLIADALPARTILLNVPYQGADDGFTTYLRTKFQETKYVGIEIEINQKWTNDPSENAAIVKALSATIDESVNEIFELQ